MSADDDFECLQKITPQKVFARLIGVSEPAVTSLLQRGVIRKGETLLTWLHAYLEHLRGVASGRGTDEDTQKELTKARIREANAKAFKAEVDTGKDLDQLIYAADVEPMLRDWAARGRVSLESAAERIIDSIESEFGIELEDTHVRDRLRAVARDLADYAQQPGADEAADLGGIPSAPSGTDG